MVSFDFMVYFTATTMRVHAADNGHVIRVAWPFTGPIITKIAHAQIYSFIEQ